MQNPNSSMVDPTSAPKRYTPPNQRYSFLPLLYTDFDSSPSFEISSLPPRNRSSNRRRSRGSSHSNEGERSQHVASGFHKENSSPTIISPEGCSRSEAYQLLSDRWADAMHLYNDPTVDLSERPMMYCGGDVWGKLPQKVNPVSVTLPPPMLPTDYRTEHSRGLADSKVVKF